MIKEKISLPIIFLLLILSLNSVANAALPFVTDDSNTQDPNQLAIETFAEKWDLPKKTENNKESTTLYGYFLSGSYGLSKNLELTMAANIGYDTKEEKTSFMNPILQLKTKIFEHQNPEIPAIAIDFGYANKNGSGEYFDPANNYYAIGTATSHLFNDKLVIHLNLGQKASFDIPNGHIYRTHLGIAFDVALINKFRLVIESYNGAPNSPRDSPNFFHSYQAGIKWVKSDQLSIYTIYGSQPTYAGNNSNGTMLFRNTSWIQCGARIVFDTL